jgi:hypothetical protein
MSISESADALITLLCNGAAFAKSEKDSVSNHDGGFEKSLRFIFAPPGTPHECKQQKSVKAAMDS